MEVGMTPKIVLRNKTVWPSRMLLPFIRRIAREEFPGTTLANTRAKLHVTIGYNRGGKYYSYCSGHAYLNSSTCTINVPFPHPGRVFPVTDFCHVVGHEFGHCRGLKHKEMGWQHGGSCRRGTYSGDHYAWAKALPVPVVVKKATPTTAEKRVARLKAAEAAVVRWTRKRKLAETALKKWTKKARALAKLVAERQVETSPLAEAACGVASLSPPVV
jgi:hypothetical protein